MTSIPKMVRFFIKDHLNPHVIIRSPKFTDRTNKPIAVFRKLYVFKKRKQKKL